MAGGNEAAGVFNARGARYNQPGRIVPLGAYLNVAQTLDAAGALRYGTAAVVRESDDHGYRAGPAATPAAAAASAPADLKRALAWTKTINALNAGRKWALRRVFDVLDPLLSESEIALAVVPSHDPFLTDPPLRELVRRLAASGTNRVDASGCLLRHTKIKRIVWGGPSYRGLHQQTIRVQNPELVAGRSVLLLDDIAKSGASLRACEELLREAGAQTVQAVALGRVARE